MIKKYKIGNPIDTEATVLNFETTNNLPNIIQKDGSIIISNIKENALIYGLGGTVHGLNKKGFRYESFCKDEPNHWEDKKALYGAHNFFIIKQSHNQVGYFIDCPSFVAYDMCFTNVNEIRITFEYPDYYLYEITNQSILEITKEFRDLIGKSYLPPKWALGYGQCRWSYKSEQEVLEVLKNHLDKKIPLDSIYLDIDYMENFKNFTIDTNRFSSLSKLSNTLKKYNVHLIPIIDAGVKDEAGYLVADEGKQNGFFCKDKDDNDFVVGVWPGYSLLPDFLNNDAAQWFGQKYQFLLDQGIDGFWNDMNEPALFYSKKNILAINDTLNNLKPDRLVLETILELQEKINLLANNYNDYKSFYHNYQGQVIAHDRVHNLYGYFMTKSASNYLTKTGKDVLLFSRASSIGAHRYGGVWQGDNYSCWAHLQLTFQQTISLNMVGFLFNGADIGGFAGDCNEQLMTRWMQYAIFQPLFRNHSAIYTKRQEVYNFKNWQLLKNIIEIRYSLINYIYDELLYARDHNTMYIRPLTFDYPNDTNCHEIEDQAFVGRSIMICPILKPNQTQRHIYLPEEMKMLKIKSVTNITETILPKGYHNVEVLKDELLIFIKKGCSLSFYNVAQNINQAGKKLIKKYLFED